MDPTSEPVPPAISIRELMTRPSVPGRFDHVPVGFLAVLSNAISEIVDARLAQALSRRCPRCGRTS